ncbi:MAG: hypothetical protein VKI39_07745 [Synechococcus sp.]|nr:hypothetical protein [Synechococcus sp.]
MAHWTKDGKAAEAEAGNLAKSKGELRSSHLNSIEAKDQKWRSNVIDRMDLSLTPQLHCYKVSGA